MIILNSIKERVLKNSKMICLACETTSRKELIIEAHWELRFNRENLENL